MRTLVVSASLLLVACGGGVDSGVDRDRQLRDLSADEFRQFCEATLEAQGGEGVTYDCGDGSTVEADTVDECAADQEYFSECDATVGQIEDCFTDWEDLCADPPPSCGPLFVCAFS